MSQLPRAARQRKGWVLLRVLQEPLGGETPPLAFLREYERSILVAGGCDRCLMRYFPLALKGVALAWLMNLPDGSVGTWGTLCQWFINRFRHYDHFRRDNVALLCFATAGNDDDPPEENRGLATPCQVACVLVGALAPLSSGHLK